MDAWIARGQSVFLESAKFKVLPLFTLFLSSPKAQATSVGFMSPTISVVESDGTAVVRVILTMPALQDRCHSTTEQPAAAWNSYSWARYIILCSLAIVLQISLLL